MIGNDPSAEVYLQSTVHIFCSEHFLSSAGGAQEKYIHDSRHNKSTDVINTVANHLKTFKCTNEYSTPGTKLPFGVFSQINTGYKVQIER